MAKFLARNGPKGTYSHFCSISTHCHNGRPAGRLSYLNISSTPVVHDNHTKDVFMSALDRYGLALGVAGTNKECLQQQTTHYVSQRLPCPLSPHHFKFNIQQFARPKHRRAFCMNDEREIQKRCNSMSSLSSGLCCPFGRCSGVPEITTDEERP